MKSFYETPRCQTNIKSIFNSMVINIMVKLTDYDNWDEEKEKNFQNLRLKVIFGF